MGWGQLYKRKLRLVVDFWRGDTITFNESLRVSFRIEKKLLSVFQFAEVTIYNLSSNTETDIFKNGRYITLEAGYEDGSYGVIFKGPIRQQIRGKEDAVTYFLKLYCVDGDDLLNLGFCNLVLSANQDQRTIINQIARNSTVPFDIAFQGDNQEVQTSVRGKVVFGPPLDALRSVSKDINANFYVDGGQGKVSKIEQGPPPIVPELNASTGLIGMPQQADQGIMFRTLLIPEIVIDSWVHINNQLIIQQEIPFPEGLQVLLDMDGLYRVFEIVYTGDTRGNDWYMDCVGISQNSNLPAMMSEGGQNIQ